jgi:exosortase/archaeosortase family protein
LTAAIAPAAPRRARPVNLGLAAAALAVAVLLVAGQEQFRRLEAFASASLLSLLQVGAANSYGTAVIFPADGLHVGFNVAAGCTAALLIVPFLLVAGVLLLAGRVPPHRAIATVAVFAGVVIVINQARLLVIAIALQAWGYPEGFERSHILMGSFVSTIGVAGGLLLFLRMVVPRRRAVADPADELGGYSRG